MNVQWIRAGVMVWLMLLQTGCLTKTLHRSFSITYNQWFEAQIKKRSVAAVEPTVGEEANVVVKNYFEPKNSEKTATAQAGRQMMMMGLSGGGH